MRTEYSVPSMKAIRKIAPNGFNVVSTFSGCGGSCLGFKMDGYEVVYANEFIPAAAETYRANHPKTPLDVRDVRVITAREIIKKMHEVTDSDVIDVLEGSPPCASFSSAGTRENSWGKVRKYSDTNQRVDDLFFEYIRLLRDLRPRVFVAENVPGLVKGKAKGFYVEIMKGLRKSGYRVDAKLVNASWLGVPQTRERVIFIGVRNDLGLDPVFPKPLQHRYSVQEILPHIRRLKLTGKRDRWEWANRPAGTIVQSGSLTSRSAYFSADMIETFDGQQRKWNVQELKKLCSFPDDFVLTGDFNKQWERLGRAVPPLMMYRIAKTIREEILCRIK
jgi:DNA (cytosine-5)-methyltransferase 1